MEELSCLNCETKLRKEDKYCPECGLKIDENLTVAVLFSNTVKNYFSVDARFFKSFIPLLVRPGFLARKFVDGKRLVYLHPAQFYLFISVVFFFFFSFITRKQQQEFESEIKDGIIQIEKED
ncbi:MAG: DUF3667 domain-containing protein, partial [bacterium]|nr:DUF3667 domain-containing protein [bacterium]